MPLTALMLLLISLNSGLSSGKKFNWLNMSLRLFFFSTNKYLHSLSTGLRLSSYKLNNCKRLATICPRMGLSDATSIVVIKASL
jgi:hypothetical protein